MNSTRVALVEVAEDGTVGGSHRCLVEIATHLDRPFVPVVVAYERNRMTDSIAHQGLEVHDWTSVRNAERRLASRWVLIRKIRVLQTVARRAAFLRTQGIALVHLNNSPDYNAFEWILAATLQRVPIIAHARGPTSATRRPDVRWSRSRLRCVIAISRYIEQHLIDVGFPRQKVRHIYDGLDLAAIRAAANADLGALRAQCNVPRDGLLAVMVGTLREWKGQHVVLEALKLLPDATLRTLRFAFVGGVAANNLPYAKRLRQMAEDSRLREVVLFLGDRADARELMAASDIVVHASKVPEPFGLVVLEAMTLGKPVVASDRGGPLEVVTPGSGLLFSPEQPGSLSEILQRLVTSPTERATLGTEAMIRAEQFGAAANAAAVSQVYRDVLS